MTPSAAEEQAAKDLIAWRKTTTMTKPFDPTKPVQTRDGRQARILCTDVAAGPPLVAAILEKDNYEHVERFDSLGSYYGTSWPHRHDLVNVPEEYTLEVWLNLYPGGAYFSRESADEYAAPNRIACIKCAAFFKEGDGL